MMNSEWKAWSWKKVCFFLPSHIQIVNKKVNSTQSSFEPLLKIYAPQKDQFLPIKLFWDAHLRNCFSRKLMYSGLKAWKSQHAQGRSHWRKANPTAPVAAHLSNPFAGSSVAPRASQPPPHTGSQRPIIRNWIFRPRQDYLCKWPRGGRASSRRSFDYAYVRKHRTMIILSHSKRCCCCFRSCLHPAQHRAHARATRWRRRRSAATTVTAST